MNDNELRTEDSLQPVKYLGKTYSPYAHGASIATEPVRLVWKYSGKGRLYNRCAVSIHPFGLCVYEEIANGTYKSVWYDSIENISYCVAEPLHRRLFAWIARSTTTNELECHVVLCKTRQQSHLLADLLARIFYQSYHYRQPQRQMGASSPSNVLSHCSVCDTITRRQQQPQGTNRLSSLSQNHSINNNHNDQHRDEKTRSDDYEHISYQGPMIARAFVRGYEGNSMNSSTRRSTDYDTTLADEESIKPYEYYRKEFYYKE